ncbi:MAG: glutathione S-transferase N-terminal domain-containing protein, partial [Pseudomonadota bacterium]
MLTIYGRATSSNVQAVMWLIGELGLDHDRVDLGHVHGGLDEPDFRAMNPMALIPVMRDGSLTMFESCAINRYLAARYAPGTGFWPDDPAERGRADMWAEWGKTTLNGAFTAPIFWSRVRTAAKDRDEAALSRAIERFEALLALVSARVEAVEWVSGARIGLADIMVGHLLHRYFDIDVPRSEPPGV